MRLRSVTNTLRRSPRWRICALVVLLWGALALASHIAGIPVTFLRISIVTAASTAMFWYLRQSLGVAAWIALLCALLHVCHPLCARLALGPASFPALAAMVFVPMAFGLVHAIVSSHRTWLGIVLGAVLGVALAVDRMGGGCLVALIVLDIACEALTSRSADGGSKRLRESVIALSIAAVVYAFIALSAPGAAARYGVELPMGDGGSAQDPTGVTAPLALVDRGGLLAARLRELPDDLTTGAGNHYLGWPVILLCLIVVCPSRGSFHRRRIAALLVMAMTLTWFLRGDASVHDQLKRLFEFATVRHYVEPTTLHLLGLLTVPLLLLAAAGFLAVGQLATRNGRLTFPALALASVAVMLWWTTTPAVTQSARRLSAEAAGSSTINASLAFLLIAAAAGGLNRVCDAFRSRAVRGVFGVVIMAWVVLDAQPYIQDALRRARGGDPAQRETRESLGNKEGACAQVALHEMQPYQKLVAHLPLRFILTDPEVQTRPRAAHRQGTPDRSQLERTATAAADKKNRRIRFFDLTAVVARV